MTGTFNYSTDVNIERITVLGAGSSSNESALRENVAGSKSFDGPISLSEEYRRNL